MGNMIEMPKFDMSMTEGTITKWLVAEGDEIEEGQDIFEVETGKASNVGDSLYTGKLLKIYCAEGQTVPVLAPIAFVGSEGEEIPAAPTAAAPAPKKEEAEAPKAAPKKEARKKEKLDLSGYDYELIIIGAGPGGYVAAIKAAQLGAKVAIIEQDELGGTCLNRGCIPTKALYTSAKIYGKLKHADKYGLSAENYGFDWGKIMSRKDGIVKTLTSGVGMLLKKNGVTVIKDTAKIIDGHTVEAGGKSISGGYIMIATGTKPISVLKNVEEGVSIMTTDDLLSMQTLPKSIVIVGGGVIGVEVANILASFDVKVTIVELMPTIVPMVDGEIAALLAKKLKAKGVVIKNGVTTTAIKKCANGIAVELSDGTAAECEAMLEAVGRGAVDGAFAQLGLERDKKGFIKTDADGCTSVDSVYAIGDVTGGYMLAHEASKQGEIAVCSMFGEGDGRDMIIPSCIFTEPEIAFVGMTEQKAKDAGYDVKVSKFPFAANGKALTLGESDGFVKVVADAKYGEILGVHIVGPEASSLIHEAVMAINLEATAQFAGDTVHAHPTLAEALMEAFLGAGSGAIHI